MPMPKLLLAILSLALSASPDARATPADLAGLDAAGFVAHNDADRPIVCMVQIAHWFSDALGRAAPGAAVVATLYGDAASGAVFMANAGGEPMPVEGLWCGFEGAAWETRSAIPLDRRQGLPLAAIEIRCAATGARLECRQAE